MMNAANERALDGMVTDQRYGYGGLISPISPGAGMLSVLSFTFWKGFDYPLLVGIAL